MGCVHECQLVPHKPVLNESIADAMSAEWDGWSVISTYTGVDDRSTTLQIASLQ